MEVAISPAVNLFRSLGMDAWRLGETPSLMSTHVKRNIEVIWLGMQQMQRIGQLESSGTLVEREVQEDKRAS